MKKVILYLEEDRIRDLINFLGVQDINDTRNIVEKYDLDDAYYTDDTLDMLFDALVDALEKSLKWKL